MNITNIPDIILCQSCLDRSIPPNAAVGLWRKLPICSLCLEGIMEVQELYHYDTRIMNNPTTFEERKAIALELLDELELIYDNWPLNADETLKCHEDFYNHRSPAIVNMTLAEIETIFSRRKGILYAVRHKDERWANEIDKLKRAARAEENLTGLTKSRKEVSKKILPSGESKAQKEKIASALGLSLSQYLAMESQARGDNFEKIVGAKKDDLIESSKTVESTSSILSGLQTKVKKSENVRINPITGKPML